MSREIALELIVAMAAIILLWFSVTFGRVRRWRGRPCWGRLFKAEVSVEQNQPGTVDSLEVVDE